LLLEQIGRGGHRPHLLHRCRLPLARRRHLPLPRLSAPAGKSGGLRAAHAGEPENHYLAAALLRVRAACRRQGPLLVASAGLRRSRERPCRGRLGAQPRRLKRDGRTRRRPRRPYRELAVAAAEGSAAAVAGAHATLVRGSAPAPPAWRAAAEFAGKTV